MDSGNIRSTGVQSLAGMDVHVQPGQLEKCKAQFDSGSRDVIPVAGEAKLQAARQQELAALESDSLEPAQTELAERSVENVSTDKPGPLRSGLNRLGQGLKKAAKAVGQRVVGELKFGKQLASSGARALRHPQQTGRQAADMAKGVLSNAKASAKEDWQEIRQQGARATLGNEMKRLGKNLKQRAISVRTMVAKLVPDKIRSISVLGLKALMTRSVQTTTPSESISKLTTDVSARKQEAKNQLTQARNELKQAQAELKNFQRLAKAQEQSDKLFTSSKDISLTFPDGEQVTISGTGSERTVAANKAFGLLGQHRSTISAGLVNAEQRVNELKESKSTIRSDVKESVEQNTSAVSNSENIHYTAELGRLKGERKSLKHAVQLLESDLKTADQQFKAGKSQARKEAASQLGQNKQTITDIQSQMKQTEANHKQTLKDLSEQLKQLNQTITSKERLKLEVAGYGHQNQVQELEQQLLTLNGQADGLSKQMSESVQQHEQARQSLSEQLEQARATDQLLAAEKKSPSGVQKQNTEELHRQLTLAKQQLQQNTRQIKTLEAQHRADQQAINKLK